MYFVLSTGLLFVPQNKKLPKWSVGWLAAVHLQLWSHLIYALAVIRGRPVRRLGLGRAGGWWERAEAAQCGGGAADAGLLTNALVQPGSSG
jgi:hypothetical protein